MMPIPSAASWDALNEQFAGKARLGRHKEFDGDLFRQADWLDCFTRNFPVSSTGAGYGPNIAAVWV